MTDRHFELQAHWPKAGRDRASPRLIGLALCLVLGGVVSCHSPSQPSPVNLEVPGWRVQQGQATWRPGLKRPEIAGELMVAQHADGRCFLQFAKTPFLLAVAQTSSNHWWIEFPPERRSFSGVGLPPSRLGWLHLCRALGETTLPVEWRFERSAGGEWQLENVRTGESMKGYLCP